MSKALIIFLTAGILGIFATGVYIISFSSKAPDEQLLDVVSYDARVLGGDFNSAVQLHASLVRRGEQGDPLAIEKAEDLISSEDEWKRAAAVQVFGSNPTLERVEKIIEALADPKERVRISAIRALFNASQKTDLHIEQHFTQFDKNVSPKEYIEVLTIKASLADSPAQQVNLIGQIFDLFTEEPENLDYALARGLTLLPRNEFYSTKVEDLIEKIDDLPDSVGSKIVAYLAQGNPDFIKVKIPQITETTNKGALRVFIQNLDRLCLENGIDVTLALLDRTAKDPRLWKLVVSKIPQVVPLRNRPNLERYMETSDLTEEDRSALTEAIALLKEAPLSFSLCHESNRE